METSIVFYEKKQGVNMDNKTSHTKYFAPWIPQILTVILLLFISTGCSSVHYTVSSAPVRVKDTGRFATSNPEVPVKVQITNFEIRHVDTQYPEKEKTLFRKHNSIAIPNLIQESIGRRQRFSEVRRVTSFTPHLSDYVITGTYDFFERIGTQGKEWIPFAGTFGAPINGATILGKLTITIIETQDNIEIFDKSFTEDHSERTSIYKNAKVGYLQADYIGNISSEIINAISRHQTKK